MMPPMKIAEQKLIHARTGICDLFCSCDLDLDPMTFTYELDPFSLEIHQMSKYELLTRRLSKVIV